MSNLYRSSDEKVIAGVCAGLAYKLDLNMSGLRWVVALVTLFLSGMSVVTSGDYQRFYIVDGEAYHHLIDPDSLTPPRFYRSVSIITTDSGYADMLSTAAFLMP